MRSWFIGLWWGEIGLRFGMSACHEVIRITPHDNRGVKSGKRAEIMILRCPHDAIVRIDSLFSAPFIPPLETTVVADVAAGMTSVCCC